MGTCEGVRGEEIRKNESQVVRVFLPGDSLTTFENKKRWLVEKEWSLFVQDIGFCYTLSLIKETS